ncbi:MAG: DUF262 domain-containing protein [Desulfobacteraceae bacterium]|nr:DUF262 domain-containing protein [Desulfobacteraceae bacterium]
MEQLKSELIKGAKLAIEAKDEAEARRLLNIVLENAPEDEHACFLLSDIEDTDERRIEALEKVVAVNPQNQDAQSKFPDEVGELSQEQLDEIKAAAATMDYKRVNELLVLSAKELVSFLYDEAQRKLTYREPKFPRLENQKQRWTFDNKIKKWARKGGKENIVKAISECRDILVKDMRNLDLQDWIAYLNAKAGNLAAAEPTLQTVRQRRGKQKSGFVTNWNLAVLSYERKYEERNVYEILPLLKLDIVDIDLITVLLALSHQLQERKQFLEIIPRMMDQLYVPLAFVVAHELEDEAKQREFLVQLLAQSTALPPIDTRFPNADALREVVNRAIVDGQTVQVVAWLQGRIKHVPNYMTNYIELARVFEDQLQDIQAIQPSIENDKSPEGEERIEHPYDPGKIRIDTRTITIDLLIKRIDEGEIDLESSFQRKPDLWTDTNKSHLIESLLIRIPLPAFYFDATDDAKWLVVDGLQRLSAFKDYFLGDMSLDNLEFLTQYEGKQFSELPRYLRRRLEESQVTVHLIQPGTPVQVKFNIFRRINTGGLVLTPQEIRNTLHQGPVISLLRRLTGSEDFRKATAWSVSPDRMEDMEFVLRFLAFTITSYQEYNKPDMDAFLSEQMDILNEKEDVYPGLEKDFKKAMLAAVKIFGSYAFRRRYSINDRYRYPVNKWLFESWSVCFGRLSDSEIETLVKEKAQMIKQAIDKHNNDKEFEYAITYGTKDVKNVHKRFQVIEDSVQEILRGKRDD